MSAYLKYFELEQSPFEGKAQSKVVLGTRALRDAFKAIAGGLAEGSARICVSGGPGFGKTSLARSLPKLLGDTARVALVRDPSVPWESLREKISRQWGVETHGLARKQLLEAAGERRLVLVVDRAEHASEEFLDHLDIMLSIRSETDEPAVQSVLFACLSGTGQGEPAPIVWWLDRIQTLDLEFAPIPREGVESYIHKHLKRAGWRGERLFSSEAALAIAGVTGGVPGEISRLCERLLAEAAERGHQLIDEEFVQGMIDVSGDAEPDDVLELIHLVADDELNANHTPSSLAKSLEHFDRTEADVSAVLPKPCDAQDSGKDLAEEDSLAALEDYLSAPVSPEELRAIRRRGLRQQLRAIAAILIAALVGAVAFAWMGDDAEEAALAGSRKSERPPLSMLESVKPSMLDAPTRTLARVRGQVASVETPAGRPFVTEARPITLPDPVSTRTSIAKAAPIVPKTARRGAAHQGNLAESPWDEGEIEQDDFEDMRPASMRPDAATYFDAEPRF